MIDMPMHGANLKPSHIPLRERAVLEARPSILLPNLNPKRYRPLSRDNVHGPDVNQIISSGLPGSQRSFGQSRHRAIQ